MYHGYPIATRLYCCVHESVFILLQFSELKSNCWISVVVTHSTLSLFPFDPCTVLNCLNVQCIFQGANLQGVKMLCSNAEGASLRGCNFEDPSGLKANLEGIYIFTACTFSFNLSLTLFFICVC